MSCQDIHHMTPITASRTASHRRMARGRGVLASSRPGRNQTRAMAVPAMRKRRQKWRPGILEENMLNHTGYGPPDRGLTPGIRMHRAITAKAASQV